MQLSLTDPALLFPAIAILMLGYVNRYVSTAAVIRGFKKDYDSGYRHVNLVSQLKILKLRISLSRYMITLAASALLMACLSMFLIFEEVGTPGILAFGLALLFMICSIGLSIYETWLSNRSLNIEINHILDQESAARLEVE